MTDKDFSKIVLNKDEMLITEAKGLYEQKSWKPAENVTYEVGRVLHVGSELPKEWVGSLVLFHMNLSTPIDIPGYGKYNVLSDNSKLVIILK